MRTTYTVTIGDDYADTIGTHDAPMWGAVGIDLFGLTGLAHRAAWLLRGPINEMVATPQRYDGGDLTRDAYGRVLTFLIYLRNACEKHGGRQVKVTIR